MKNPLKKASEVCRSTIDMFRGRALEDEPKKLDITPLEMPAGVRVPRPLTDVIAAMVKTAVEAERGVEFETPEEADDFDVPDDPDNELDLSIYEIPDVIEQEPIDRRTDPEQPDPEPDPPEPDPEPDPEPTPPEET